ncbi:MAG: hypothetical protein JOZ02_22940 [Acidobacteria bacterium]|nr:hypothetical protein [Acidobacteriota bacterium]
MSDPKHPADTQVDPSEGALDGVDDQRIEASEAEGQESSMLEVDPSEGPAE